MKQIYLRSTLFKLLKLAQLSQLDWWQLKVLKRFFKKTIPGLFIFIFVFSVQLTVNVQYKFWPMTGFELRTSGIASNHSTNCATTTAMFENVWGDWIDKLSLVRVTHQKQLLHLRASPSSFPSVLSKNKRVAWLSTSLSSNALAWRLKWLWHVWLSGSVTRYGDLLDFGQLFKAFGNNYFAQISHSLRQFL